MGVPKMKTKVSVEDYLAGEIISPIRHEYIDGEVYEMAGGSDNHNRILLDLAGILNANLRGSRCEVFSSDIKIRATRTVYYYPDLLVSCEENPDDSHFRNEPILIIEITSPSTRGIDRREKLLFYQAMASVQEYLIVEQDKMKAEVHRRQPNGGWMTHYFNESSDTVELQSINLTIPLPDLYVRVKLKPYVPFDED